MRRIEELGALSPDYSASLTHAIIPSRTAHALTPGSALPSVSVVTPIITTGTVTTRRAFRGTLTSFLRLLSGALRERARGGGLRNSAVATIAHHLARGFRRTFARSLHHGAQSPLPAFETLQLTRGLRRVQLSGDAAVPMRRVEEIDTAARNAWHEAFNGGESIRRGGVGERAICREPRRARRTIDRVARG